MSIVVLCNLPAVNVTTPPYYVILFAHFVRIFPLMLPHLNPPNNVMSNNSHVGFDLSFLFILANEASRKV